MASQTPSSKSQQRAARLLNVKIDYSDYTAAGAALEAAGVNSAGLPKGETWRSAAKLSDADLVAKLRASDNVTYAAANALDARNHANAWRAMSRSQQRAVIAANRRAPDYRDEEMRDFDAQAEVAANRGSGSAFDLAEIAREG